jgi:hypothetical protein
LASHKAIHPVDPLHDIDLVEGQFMETSRSDLENAFVAFRKSATPDHLCVFFHGGLAPRADGLATAQALIADYTKSGCYPFFFIWNSGLLEVLKDDLHTTANQPEFVRAARLALKYIAPRMAAALAGTKAGRALAKKVGKPKRKCLLPNTLAELESYARPFDLAWTEREGAQLGTSARELEQLDDDLAALHKKIPPKKRLFKAAHPLAADGPLARLVLRLNAGRDHGLYTTIVEELLIAAGADTSLTRPAWNTMKQSIDRSFATPEAGGSAFLFELCKVWQPGMRITLIGHSAGALYVQAFLEALDQRPDAPAGMQCEVVFLAAAISFARLHWGQAVFARRVQALRAFGLDDATEERDWLVPLVYDKSLLYLVSALCESDQYADMPLVGMQRYWSARFPYLLPEVTSVTALLDPARAVWSPTAPDAPPGYRSRARHHAELPVEAKTNASVCTALKKWF